MAGGFRDSGISEIQAALEEYIPYIEKLLESEIGEQPVSLYGIMTVSMGFIEYLETQKYGKKLGTKEELEILSQALKRAVAGKKGLLLNKAISYSHLEDCLISDLDNECNVCANCPPAKRFRFDDFGLVRYREARAKKGKFTLKKLAKAEPMIFVPCYGFPGVVVPHNNTIIF